MSPRAASPAQAPDRPLDEVVADLSRWLTHRFDSLRALADEMLSLLRFDSDGLLDLTDASRRRLKSVAAGYLADHTVVDGCGLIFAHSALGTPNGHLEWWVREDETRFARYSFGVVPGADRYYDYEQLEWFTRAFNEGSPVLVGPYIDYLGVEAYVVTLTVPAETGGVRVGAVGNDIQAEDLEADLLPILLGCERELVVVNGHDNVLISNSSRFLPGEQVPDAEHGFDRVQLAPTLRDVQLLVRKRQTR